MECVASSIQGMGRSHQNQWWASFGAGGISTIGGFTMGPWRRGRTGHGTVGRNASSKSSRTSGVNTRPPGIARRWAATCSYLARRC
eukprot:11338175-Heterocapsa_arctica.AAC.1